MSLGSDERAQSTLVGAILLFAILIIAFSSYQAFVVPNQNAEVEFNHNQDVQTDMQELRNSLLDVRSVRFDENNEPKVVSEHRPVRVQLGTQFPERLIALNPTAPSGTLETEDGTFEIRNANVTSTQFNQYEDDLIRSHDTKLIAYEPSYTEYQNSPITRFEHSLAYNDFDDANIETSNQRLIRGLNDNVIDVVLLEGDVSRSSSGSVTIDPETVDGPTERVPIEQDNGPIELEFTTNQPEVWENELSDIANVDSVTPSGDSVVVELNDSEYDLRMTTVRLEGDGGDGPFTEIQKEPTEAAGDGSEPVFNTEWLDQDGNQIDETIEIEPGDMVPLIIEVTGRTSTEPIQQKRIEPEDLDIAGDINAFEEFSFPGDQETDTDGRVDVDVSSADADSANDGDEFETYVTAGDDSDVVVFEVVDEETMADRIEAASSDSFGGANSELRFTLDNTGGGDSMITDITIDSTDTNATFVENQAGGDTLRTEGGDTLFEDRIDIGNQENINNLNINDGNQATVELGQFRDGAGSGDRINMNGQQATITFTFDDGSQGTYIITG